MFQSGTLWRAVTERTAAAAASGALAPIETEQEEIEDAGVRFVVRRVSSLARKAAQRSDGSAKTADGKDASPEFPIERDLCVADVSPAHVAVLNKFPVIPDHLLLVTRRFVAQETLLDEADFAALCACLGEYDALGFYNGGIVAGASQPHKHLQIVPLPLASGRAVPMEALFESVPRAPEWGITTVPGLAFRHAFAWREPATSGAGALMPAQYRALLSAAGIDAVEREGAFYQSAPYNLLVTRTWMLVVARSQERFDGISINALGYAGSIFVKDDAKLARVRKAGPMRVIASVASGVT